jgi:hypothetical protein
VYTPDGGPAFVNEHPDAVPVAARSASQDTQDTQLYCLITSTHRIPVAAASGAVIEFADWEEISSDTDLAHWHAHVFEVLNAGARGAAPAPTTTTTDILHSEAVISGRTKIWTPLGPAEIRGIHPGDAVLDAHGKPTRVTGVVCVDGSQVRAAEHLGGDAWISAAAWTSSDGGSTTWGHPTRTGPADGIHDWYSLFTEAGTFRLCEVGAIGLAVRDFTDIGADRIEETYTWVLDSLAAAGGGGH